MTRQIQTDLTPEEYHSAQLTLEAVARAAGVRPQEVAHCRVVRRSLDLRRRQIVYHTTAELYMQGEPFAEAACHPAYRDCHAAPPVLIVGAGPAGLFAALRALELGLRPVIVERGKPVEERKADIALLGRERRVNPDSNWCFGEGGAGTYSDGKLYTRSTKRGDVGAVLRKFVEHGADPDILLDAHAHIGTDRLSPIIAAMRRTIEGHGGEYHFGSRLTGIECLSPSTAAGPRVRVRCADGSTHEGIALLLATGHSARDVYALFSRRGWRLEAKPFALGVRVEHPQRLINEIQYHGPGYSPLLPPAAYSLTTQVGTHGVFSFCMCPGGVIVPAATADGQQVVNGMSNAGRTSAFANSGIAVTVCAADIGARADDPLALLRFQQEVEARAFEAGQRSISAPAQRLVDFLRRKPSQSIGRTNYLGPVENAPLHEVLPPFVADCLAQGFRDFDRKMRGFVSAEATLLAVESRTSSPVRIPRDAQSLQHPDLPAVYPCGEGAGYAGGIVSSALDGVRCIEAVAAACPDALRGVLPCAG